MMEFLKEFIEKRKFTLVIALAVLGLVVMIIGMNGVAGVFLVKIENAITKDIIPKLPHNLAISYKKIKINLLTQSVTIPEFSIYNKAEEIYEFKVRKIIISDYKMEKDILLSIDLKLVGITSEKEEFKQFTLRKVSYIKNAQPAAYKNIPQLNTYFKDCELSAAIRYKYDPAKKIVSMERIGLVYGDKIKIALGIKLGNITKEQIQGIIKARDKEKAMQAVLQQSKPLESDILIGFDFEDIDVKDLASSFPAVQGMQGMYSSDKIPEEFDILYKLHINSNYDKKTLSIKNISIGLEPGIRISLNMALDNIDFDDFANFSAINIDDFELKLEDRKGMDTVVNITADLKQQSEAEVREEFKQSISQMIQMYELGAILGDDVSKLEDFLFTEKDKLVIRKKPGVKLDAPALMNAMANLPEFISTHLEIN